MGFVAVLEGVDQVAAGPLIGKGRPGRVKTGWQGTTATTADMIRSETCKGDAAHDAKRRATIGGISSRQPGQIWSSPAAGINSYR